MKKRVFCFMLVTALSMLFVTAAIAATVEPMQATGHASISTAGKVVTYGGVSSSLQKEDVIRVTAILWEQRGATWYEVTRVSEQKNNGDYVSASGSKTVTGGYYYKTTAIHYSQKNGQSYTTNTESPIKWVAK